MADNSGAIVIIGGVFIVGFIFGHIVGAKREGIALEWAVERVSECEETYETEGYGGVAECFEIAVSDAEEARRDSAM